MEEQQPRCLKQQTSSSAWNGITLITKANVMKPAKVKGLKIKLVEHTAHSLRPLLSFTPSSCCCMWLIIIFRMRVWISRPELLTKWESIKLDGEITVKIPQLWKWDGILYSEFNLFDDVQLFTVIALTPFMIYIIKELKQCNAMQNSFCLCFFSARKLWFFFFKVSILW